MSFTVTSPPSSRPPLRRLRLGLDILLLMLLLLLAAVGLTYWYIRADQPQVDGTLQLAGLQAPVSVIRDHWGVPHIQAANIHDLYFAQGFVMAQDRLWQMDVLRRLGEGRLAEVFGPAALDSDRENRELGLNRAAAAEAARLSPPRGDNGSAILAAFTAGVNAFIQHRGRVLPLEFELLGYRPQPWRPEDTLAVGVDMYQMLASDYKDKLEHEAFLAQLGAALGGQLFPQTSPWDIVPGAPFSFPRRSFGPFFPGRGRGRGAALQLPVFPAQLGRRPPPRGGSNDWVVAGTHSFSGQPILANDPHLAFQIPGLWWVAQLQAPGIDVAGAAIAGVPGVIIGHNQNIAWGVTNTRADVQDLYREQLDGQGNVLTPAGWQPLQHWHEVIHVKGAADVAVNVRVAPQGPLVASDAGGALALRWTLYAPGALRSSTSAFNRLDRATDWAEFEAALAGFAGPVQNFVYADRQGHIAYQCAGWVPLRRGFDGSVPVAGDQAAFAWQGWIPFAQLPRVEDPASGMLATANGRIAPAGYPYTISTDWDSPNRTRRIYQLLSQLPRWNASAMARVQTDVFSEEDRDFAAAVEAAGRDSAANPHPDAELRQALGVLRGFRGFMGATSPGPTLAVETRWEFLRRVLAAKVGDAMARQYDWDEAPVFEQWLLSQRPAAWLPPAYAAKGRQAGWDALLLDSLASVASRYTLNRDQLRWGRFETLSIEHPVFSHLPLLRDVADLGPVEINGSPLTVKQARNVALGDTSTLGPSMRFIADLGNWDRSSLTLVAGESGQIFSPHYRDQWSDYLRGLAVPLWFSPAAVVQHATHHLTLTPLATDH